MAVTFEAAGTFVAGTGAVTPGMPAGIQANDILILFVETANQAASLSTANGFVQVGTPAGTGTAANASSTRLTAFWKRAVGGDSSPVVADSGDHQAARIGLWRGARKTGDPWGTVTPVYSVDATSDTTGNPTGVTTAAANCGIIVGASNTVDSNTGLTLTYSNATVTGFTGTGMGDNTNAGGGGGFNVGFGTKASAGAMGTTTVTYSTASIKSMVVIALEPHVDLPPSAPTITSVAAQDAYVQVYFTAPSDNGGQAILDYRATATPVGGGTTVVRDFLPTSSPLNVTGLTNGTTYTVTIAARNSIGYGTESAASAQFTPLAPAIGRSPATLTFDWEIPA